MLYFQSVKIIAFSDFTTFFPLNKVDRIILTFVFVISLGHSLEVEQHVLTIDLVSYGKPFVSLNHGHNVV